MTGSDTGSDISADAEIRREIRELSGIYGLDTDDDFRTAVASLDFSHYAEYVIGERNLEIVCGGVGQQQQLMRTAASLDVPSSIITSFAACANRFPHKMAYFKLCFGSGHDQPTLYLNLMEPWETALELLDGVPEVRDALPELRRSITGSRVCVLLAFSVDGAGNLVVKTYHPARRNHASSPAPLMVSYRLSNGGVSQSPKYYRALAWDEMTQAHPGLEGRVARVRDILSGRYRVVYGYLLSSGSEVKPKLYIFRKDSRIASAGRKNDSLYTAEGNVLLRLGRFEDAVEAFDDAIVYNGRDFAAYVNRALCHAVLGRHDLAVEDAAAAKALDPDLNFQQSEFFVRFIAEVVQVSEQINTAPSAESYNRLGVLLFSRGLFREARRNFELAVTLDDQSAEAYNNLGGACINLGQFSEALEYCGKAINLDGHVDATNYRLALDGLRRSASHATA